MNLRARARQCENVECIQASASELIYINDAVVGVKLNTDEDLFADLVIVADGYLNFIYSSITLKMFLKV